MALLSVSCHFTAEIAIWRTTLTLQFSSLLLRSNINKYKCRWRAFFACANLILFILSTCIARLTSSAGFKAITPRPMSAALNSSMAVARLDSSLEGPFVKNTATFLISLLFRTRLKMFRATKLMAVRCLCFLWFSLEQMFLPLPEGSSSRGGLWNEAGSWTRCCRWSQKLAHPTDN